MPAVGIEHYCRFLCKGNDMNKEDEKYNKWLLDQVLREPECTCKTGKEERRGPHKMFCEVRGQHAARLRAVGIIKSKLHAANGP